MNAKNNRWVVLIAAQPGPLPLALQVLLLSLPQIAEVQIANIQQGIGISATALHPDLVIMIDDTRPRWGKLPQLVRAQSPHSRIVFLATNGGVTEGADLVLQQGISPEDLLSALIELMET